MHLIGILKCLRMKKELPNDSSDKIQIIAINK